MKIFLIAVSLIAGFSISIFSYAIPYSGIDLSNPGTSNFIIGGYPFVAITFYCPASSQQSCGPASFNALGLAIDTLFWAAIVFSFLYLKTRKKKR